MKKLLIIAMIVAAAGNVFAEQQDLDDYSTERCWTPIELNLASPLGILWADRDVYGLRANIFYGHSLKVYGLDLGLVGAAHGNVYGLQVNGFNFDEGTFRGVQAGLLGNFTVRTAYGVQFGGLINWGLDDGIGLEVAPINIAGGYTGLQAGVLNWNDGQSMGLDVGFANVAKADFTGAHIGVANYCKGTFSGCQFGIFNMVFGHSEGLQLGVFNASDEHRGAQIGLLNLNAGGTVPLMVLVNVNFR